MSRDLVEKLTAMYLSKGLIRENPRELPAVNLIRKCAHCAACWRPFTKVWKDEYVSTLSRPWIGDSYERSRVLVVGINMNDDYGWDEIHTLIESSGWGARAELLKGIYVHRFNNTAKNYVGTRLFCRLAQVGTVVQCCLTNEPSILGGDVSAQRIANGFDWVAFTNHVKCSPGHVSGQARSRPSNAMWSFCGRHVLREEIAILKPRLIVVFGSDRNFAAILNNALDSHEKPEEARFNHIKTTRGMVADAKIDVIGVPHPSIWRGRRHETWTAAEEAIRLALST